jgi:hypothetical protein
LTNLNLLPASLLPAVADADADRLNKLAARGETYQSMATHKRASVRVLNPTSIQSTYNGMDQYLDEVARADFDGDGNEEILIVETAHAESGTLGVTGAYLLKKTSSTSTFTVLDVQSASDAPR